MDRHIRPTGKQEDFISSTVDEVFFGGSRGGGKTFACLLDFAASAEVYGRDAKGIFFRKTNPELEEAVTISKDIFRGYATWRVGDRMWTFANGATLKLRFIDRDEDVQKYHGHSYSTVYFDELGNWATDFSYLFMFSSLRSARGVPLYMRSTGNPGGPGAAWIKRRFITDKTHDLIYEEEGHSSQFIQSRLEDNPLLMADGKYEQNLKQLPDHLYQAFRWGDWNVFAGQVFSEFHPDTHVIEPFPLDSSWYKFASMDWGYAKPYSIGFWALGQEGRLIRFTEFYGSSDGGNEGTRESIREVFQKVSEAAAFVGIEDMVADPACWAKMGFSEESVESVFSEFFTMFKGVNDRVNGANAVHNFFKTKLSDGGPMLCVFPNCKDFIRTIPALTAAKTNPEDVDTRIEDHAYDDARYAVMYVKAESSYKTNGWGNAPQEESLLRRRIGGYNGR